MDKKTFFPNSGRGKNISFSVFSLTVIAFCLLLFSGCVKTNMAPDLGADKIAPEKKFRASLVNTARSNLGIKYKYGGVSPKTGFDCSGLVLWSYLQHGIKIPRTAAEQMSFGKEVKKEELQPGDIIGFKIPRRRGVRYHTALYEGGGKFIHSPTTGKRVQEGNLNSSYWKKKFMTARRVPRSLAGNEKQRTQLATRNADHNEKRSVQRKKQLATRNIEKRSVQRKKQLATKNTVHKGKRISQRKTQLATRNAR